MSNKFCKRSTFSLGEPNPKEVVCQCCGHCALFHLNEGVLHYGTLIGLTQSCRSIPRRQVVVAQH